MRAAGHGEESVAKWAKACCADPGGHWRSLGRIARGVYMHLNCRKQLGLLLRVLKSLKEVEELDAEAWVGRHACPRCGREETAPGVCAFERVGVVLTVSWLQATH